MEDRSQKVAEIKDKLSKGLNGKNCTPGENCSRVESLIESTAETYVDLISEMDSMKKDLESMKTRMSKERTINHGKHQTD